MDGDEEDDIIPDGLLHPLDSDDDSDEDSDSQASMYMYLYIYMHLHVPVSKGVQHQMLIGSRDSFRHDLGTVS